MIRGLPCETVNPEVSGTPSGELYVFVLVVPPEQNIPPVEERYVATRALLLIGHGSQVAKRNL